MFTNRNYMPTTRTGVRREILRQDGLDQIMAAMPTLMQDVEEISLDLDYVLRLCHQFRILSSTVNLGMIAAGAAFQVNIPVYPVVNFPTTAAALRTDFRDHLVQLNNDAMLYCTINESLDFEIQEAKKEVSRRMKQRRRIIYTARLQRLVLVGHNIVNFGNRVNRDLTVAVAMANAWGSIS